MFAAVTKSERNGPVFRFFMDLGDAVSYVKRLNNPSGVVGACRLDLAYEHFKVKEANKLLRAKPKLGRTKKLEGVPVFGAQNLDIAIATTEGIKCHSKSFTQFPPEDIRWIGDNLRIPRRNESDAQVNEQSSVTSAWVQKSLRDQAGNEARQSHNGFVSMVRDEIELLHTDTLLEKVERVLSVSHPGLVELEMAKKMLKDHEWALIDVISKLDSRNETEPEYMNNQLRDGRNGPSFGLKAG